MRGKIKIKAMCLFQKNGKVLISKGFDKMSNENFYRVLGGSINFYESSEAGVRREIDEELHSKIENLKFISIVENLFAYEGKKCHEIIFLYSGDLSRKELYKENSIHIVDGPHAFDAIWIPMDEIIAGKIPLYPTFDYKTILIS